jgi:hypothetical protein
MRFAKRHLLEQYLLGGDVDQNSVPVLAMTYYLRCPEARHHRYAGWVDARNAT